MVSQETPRFPSLSTSQSDLGCLNQGNPTPGDVRQRAPNKVHPFRVNKKYQNIIFVVVMMVVPSLGTKPWEDQNLISGSPPKISKTHFKEHIEMNDDCRNDVAGMVFHTWQNFVDKNRCTSFPSYTLAEWKGSTDIDLSHWACFSFRKYLAQQKSARARASSAHKSNKIEKKARQRSRASTDSEPVKSSRASRRPRSDSKNSSRPDIAERKRILARREKRVQRRMSQQRSRPASRDSKSSCATNRSKKDSNASARPSIAKQIKDLKKREKRMRRVMDNNNNITNRIEAVEPARSVDSTSDTSRSNSTSGSHQNANTKFTLLSLEKFVELAEQFGAYAVLPDDESTTDFLRADVQVNSFDDETQFKQYSKWAASNPVITTLKRADTRIRVKDIEVLSTAINGTRWGCRYLEYQQWYANYGSKY